MTDQFDVTLEDDELLDEVELTTNLIVAATESDGPMTEAEIDALLGIIPPAQARSCEDGRPPAQRGPVGAVDRPAG